MEAAIVFPLLPGKRLALEQFVQALAEDRRAEHDQFHWMVDRESWFLQPTLQGDLVIIYLEASDPMEVFGELAISQGDFAVWFRTQVLDLTGLNLTRLPPFCMPARILHRVRAERTGIDEDRDPVDTIAVQSLSGVHNPEKYRGT